MPTNLRDEPCGCCGNEPEECVCALAPDFPEEGIPELDTNWLDYGYYEEYNKLIEEENSDETSR